MGTTANFLDEMGTVFGFCHERIAGKGEDSCCFRFHEQGGIMAVFDGCGGSGAESYARFGNHSGAYLASRAAAAATVEWFDRQEAGNEFDAAALDECIVDALAMCDRYAEQPQSKIRGSITRSLPTTMAGFAFRRSGSQTTVHALSAGDSHLYLLDEAGLKQLNCDDVSGGDAFSNLYNDPPMTNVISRDGGFTIDWRDYGLNGSCVLMAATDGCFGYFKSPMEFELLLLDALMKSRSIDDWQAEIENGIEAVAGDDQTLLALVYGYRSFAELKRSFKLRFEELRRLVAKIGEFGDGFAERSTIWDTYRLEYYSLIGGEFVQ